VKATVWGLMTPSKVPLYHEDKALNVYGGSLFSTPRGVDVVVNLAGWGDGDIILPIRDYGVPKNDGAVRAAVLKALVSAISGKRVYVGCAGGLGRTGLFLAVMYKALAESYGKVQDPVLVTRALYHEAAIETKDQEEYVRKIDVQSIATVLRWLR